VVREPAKSSGDIVQKLGLFNWLSRKNPLTIGWIRTTTSGTHVWFQTTALCNYSLCNMKNLILIMWPSHETVTFIESRDCDIYRVTRRWHVSSHDIVTCTESRDGDMYLEYKLQDISCITFRTSSLRTKYTVQKICVEFFSLFISQSIAITRFLENLSGNLSFMKIWQKQRVLYVQTYVHRWSYLAQLYLEWKIFQTKFVEKIKASISI